MLKILISEDNLYKLKNIQDTIEKQFNETNITNVLHCRYGKLTGNRNTHLMPYLTFIFAMTQKKH